MITFNKNKFGQVLHLLIHSCGNLENVGKTVLYKLLYFSDFDYYEKYEKPLTGEKYVKLKNGPAPTHFDTVIMSLKKQGKVKEIRGKFRGYNQIKFLSLDEPRTMGLNSDELVTINKVIQKLSGMTATQISAYSHEDMPWKTAKIREILDYDMVFYRSPVYSVTDENDLR